MLRKAEERRLQSSAAIRQRLVFIEGDMRTWAAKSEFDLILIPCSSISLCSAWKTSSRYGEPATAIFVRAVDSWSKINMPNMASFADSFSVPSRTPVEINLDNLNESDGTRLIRRKTMRYLSHEQRAQIRFIYEKYEHGRGVESSIDDFVSHVFFPRELCLLFLHTGYEIEQTFGDYRARPLKGDSPLIIMIGRRND